METSLFRVVETAQDTCSRRSRVALPKKNASCVSRSVRSRNTTRPSCTCLCRKALRAGYPNFAFQILEEVIRQNPDQPAARRILGYKLRGKEWVTPFAAEQLEKGYVWDDTFGWLPKEHLAKYKAGKRWCSGRWMSVEQEAEICRDIHHAWHVRTDHYLVRTNYSLERGVEIAKSSSCFTTFSCRRSRPFSARRTRC